MRDRGLNPEPMRSRTPPHYDFMLGSPPRRGRGAGVVLSIVLHLSIVLLLLIPLRRDFARVLDQGRPAFDRSGGGGGGGEGRTAYISLPAPRATARVTVEVHPPQETPPPVVVTPPVDPPPTIPPPVAEQAVPVAEAVVVPGTDSVAGSGPGQGGGTGGGQGGGIGPGTGPGTGPGAGGGAGGRGRAPQPRHLILPPGDAPKELRGVAIQVTFWVDAAGRVARVAFDPPVDNRKFAGKLAEAMRNYRFRPALGPDGAPIAATYMQTVTIF